MLDMSIVNFIKKNNIIYLNKKDQNPYTVYTITGNTGFRITGYTGFRITGNAHSTMHPSARIITTNNN